MHTTHILYRYACIAGSDKIRRMKLAYSDTSIDARQSAIMWSDLIVKATQKDSITLSELHQAIRQGMNY